ncbi:hypothetical protein GCM10009799_24470 [Nocardiopsis rhodophaea]|uniref:Methyltransferase type 11 domain-containing protein n=1 Tax=Nocardiopsis rhodophaea TaxID=280238 RepID=A0ABN2T1K4_9ACTN
MVRPQAVYPHGQHASVVRSYQRRTVANSAAYLADELRPGSAVLDVGCGPGSITADIAERVSPGRVVAVDASPEAVATARRTAADHGVRGVEFAVADVHALDFPDATFDVVHAHQVLQYVADPVRALSEMRRVCRPGGTHRRPRRRLRDDGLAPRGAGTGRVDGAVSARRPARRR